MRLQPVGPSHFAVTGKQSGLRVLFLGDSRVLDWPPLPPDRFLTINAGVAGETTAQILLRTESALDAESPAVVVVQAGINDLKAIGVMPGPAERIRSQCVTNLQEIASLCRKHHVRTILTTIPPSGKVPIGRRLVWSPEIDASVKEVNQALLRLYATNEEVVVLDIDGVLRASRRAPSDLSDYRDTLHLQPSAYGKLEPELLRVVERLSPPPAPVQPESTTNK
ncbi:MAG TPA: GDSL-type esterase/lipase family protein [Verrucomicrobiae bacterium]|nr:GDSL-type esterase/lipase family protein [Verrucomicrobiae bacterium]